MAQERRKDRGIKISRIICTTRSVMICILHQVLVKLSHYRPGQTLRASRISRQQAHECGKVVSSTHRPILPPGDTHVFHFSQRQSRLKGRDDPIENRTRNLTACSAMTRQQGDKIKYDYMGMPCCTCIQAEKCAQDSGGDGQSKGPFGRPRCEWENTLNSFFKSTGGMEWINFTVERDM